MSGVSGPEIWHWLQRKVINRHRPGAVEKPAAGAGAEALKCFH